MLVSILPTVSASNCSMLAILLIVSISPTIVSNCNLITATVRILLTVPRVSRTVSRIRIIVIDSPVICSVAVCDLVTALLASPVTFTNCLSIILNLPIVLTILPTPITSRVGRIANIVNVSLILIFLLTVFVIPDITVSILATDSVNTRTIRTFCCMVSIVLMASDSD